MANNLSITPGAGAIIRTDQGNGSGAHTQVVKLGESAPGGENLLTATVANGLTVDVTRIQTPLTVNNTVAANLKVDASGATVPVSAAAALPVSAPVGAPVSVRISNGAAAVDIIPVAVQGTVPISGSVGITGNPAVAQSGTWNIGAVTSITNPVAVTGTVALSGTSPVSGTVTGNQGTPAVAANAWPTKISDGTNAAGLSNVGGNFAVKVDVIKQTGGGVSQQDKTSFVEGTTFVEPVGGVLNDTIASDPAEDQAAAVRITPKRAFHVNIRKQDGTELGIAATPVRMDPTGTTTQPVSGTVTANQGGAPWSGNTTQIAGVAVVAASAGVQKVGVSDAAGAAFSQANPLQTQNAPSGGTGGAAQTPWKFSTNIVALSTANVLRTPGGGFRFYLEALVLVVAGAGAGSYSITVYDGSNAAANIVWQGVAPAGVYTLTPARPIPSNAINNVLKVDIGGSGSVNCWVTVIGYDA